MAASRTANARASAFSIHLQKDAGARAKRAPASAPSGVAGRHAADCGPLSACLSRTGARGRLQASASLACCVAGVARDRRACVRCRARRRRRRRRLCGGGHRDGVGSHRGRVHGFRCAGGLGRCDACAQHQRDARRDRQSDLHKRLPWQRAPRTPEGRVSLRPIPPMTLNIQICQPKRAPAHFQFAGAFSVQLTTQRWLCAVPIVVGALRHEQASPSA